MANFMTKEKARVVALHFLQDGCKSAAMEKAGFPADYSRSSAGYQMYRGKMVQAAIAELEAESEKLTGDLSLETVVQGFRDMAFPKEGINVANADRNYALDKLAKIRGGYVDRLLVGRDDETAVPVSAADAELYREMARAAIKARMGSPGPLPVLGPVSIRDEVEAELCSKFPDETDREVLFEKFSNPINDEVLRRERTE